MSTNFYMMTTDRDIVHKYFPGEYEVVESPYLGFEIHIGKRSMGWKPLMEAHNNAYTSVAEMLEFLHRHKDVIKIYDEYEEQYSIEQLKDELIDWGDHQEKRIIDYDRVGPIQAPIDHVEMSRRDKSCDYGFIRYWHDKDGYDFTDRSFC